MVLSRNREKLRQCARFLNKFEEVSHSVATVPLLEFYENYKEYVAKNAIGYELSIGDFQDEISKKFPNTKTDNGVVRGLMPRVKAPRPEVRIDPFDRVMVRRCNELKTRELKPYFTLTTLLNYNEIDNEVVSEEQVLAWLNDSRRIFYCKSSGVYHFVTDNYENIAKRWSI